MTFDAIKHANAVVLLTKDSFTWGEWVEACGWDYRAACIGLITVQHNGFETGECQLSLDQYEDADSGIWDGCFEVRNERLHYAGSDGPSGGTDGVVLRREVKATDVISVL